MAERNPLSTSSAPFYNLAGINIKRFVPPYFLTGQEDANYGKSMYMKENCQYLNVTPSSVSKVTCPGFYYLVNKMQNAMAGSSIMRNEGRFVMYRTCSAENCLDCFRVKHIDDWQKGSDPHKAHIPNVFNKFSSPFEFCLIKRHL